MNEGKFEIGTRRCQMLHSDVNEGGGEGREAKTSQHVPALFVRQSLKRQTRAAADFGPRLKLHGPHVSTPRSRGHTIACVDRIKVPFKLRSIPSALTRARARAEINSLPSVENRSLA